MRASIRSVFSSLLLSLGLMAITGAQAGVEGVNDGEQQLPPPPGPYVSSRPNLQATPPMTQEESNRLPFIDNMPTPNMPMRYMPSPRQFPVPNQWWRGPMGR